MRSLIDILRCHTIPFQRLTGTDVTDVNVDLASTLGGAAGDSQAEPRDRQRHQR